MHWLLLAAAMSALMNHASGVALWAIQRHRAARAGLD